MCINYTDGEVTVYHPVCEEALNKALLKLGINSTYEIKHHEMTGSLEMDFVVKNKLTGKYLCIIEVKRTPADIHSSRNQSQALSYILSSFPLLEKPFYVITNLEYAYTFRYESSRPRLVQQMLKPGLAKIADFSGHNRNDFISKLSDYFSGIISSFIQDAYEYTLSLQRFTEHMELMKNDRKNWHSSLIVLLYEYIRGAFQTIGRGNDLKDIRRYADDIKDICDEATQVNFDSIFSFDPSFCHPRFRLDSSLMGELYNLGLQNVTAEYISDILHGIACEGKEHEGKVSTDTELSRAVSVLSRYLYGNIPTNKCVCDPAAGSGSLISAAVDVFSLEPSQVIANDIDPFLLELLSLRLGLNFSKVIAKGHSPKITCNNIINLNPDYFKDVGIVVMNPPYVSGVYSASHKPAYAKRIKELSGITASLDVGQIGLECIFLELIVELCSEGTVFACIMPKAHLFARGIEAIEYRKFLLNKFGLELVFYYPRQDIFEAVLKDTCVLFGRKGSTKETISFVSSYERVPDIDMRMLYDALTSTSLQQDSFGSIAPGIEGMVKTKTDLYTESSNGWRTTFSELTDSTQFVKKVFSSHKVLEPISESEFRFKRGQVANKGASELVFITAKKDFYDKAAPYIKKTYPAIKNAKINKIILNSGDEEFFNLNEAVSTVELDYILDYYCTNVANNGGRQTKKSKSPLELKKLLEMEATYITPQNCVLIPRAIRRNGSVYVTSVPMYISTNLFILYTLNERNAMIISSWISTLMYQLISEVSAKDQEGARKMERHDIEPTLIPIPDLITDEQYDEITRIVPSIEFVDLYNPEIREIDELWAKILFPTNYTEVLNETKKQLKFIVNRRDPQ